MGRVFCCRLIADGRPAAPDPAPADPAGSALLHVFPCGDRSRRWRIGSGLVASGLAAILVGTVLFPFTAGLPTVLGATLMFVFVSGALVLLIHSLKVLLVERTESAQRETLLRRELQHRVGNFVQMTLGVARMQARAEPDPAIRAALNVFRSRIQAFAQAQQEILNPKRRPLADLLADICRMQTRSFFGGKVDCEFNVRNCSSRRISCSRLR
jgi:hypothetical protein